MNKTKLRKRTRGQGLVEYALILALVAVVVIASAWAMGQAIKRVYGVVGGALGKNNSIVGQVEIQSAICWVVSSPAAKTGLVIKGLTTKPVTTLIGSTNKNVGTDVNGDPAPVTADLPANSFIWQPYLSFTAANATLCPPSVVIQAKDGTTTFSPVTIQYSP